MSRDPQRQEGRRLENTWSETDRERERQGHIPGGEMLRHTQKQPDRYREAGRVRRMESRTDTLN